jgi:ERCC4-type nuclease|tara:strand:+ start:315 stop:1031 length:717 start_codon:yes stop_codon:yes gene_type:complete
MKPLIIDSNERGPLPDAIERHAQKMKPSVPVRREKLIVGDYKCGDWYIEAKTVGDFLQSVQNGHLARQLDNLDANCQQFGIVVWGSVSEYAEGVRLRATQRGESAEKIAQMTVSRYTKLLCGSLARIAADFGCLVYRAPNLLEAPYFLSALHQKTYKAASRHGAQAIKRVSTNDVRFDMLRTIPGIGPEMVDAILDECGSIEEAACADCLRQVPRMGKVLRARVVEALTSEDPVRVER